MKDTKAILRARTASASQLIPGVTGKPSVIWRWLLTSHWFYVSIILTLIVMNTAVPSAVDKTLSIVYPQVETKSLFGLLTDKSDDPRIAWQGKIIMGVLWTLACGLNAYVLFLCLPGIAEKATRKAREKEAEADAMMAVKPSESILLYTTALKLTVDQHLESSLKSKIARLDNAIKNGKIQKSQTTLPENPEASGTGTIELSMQDFSNQSDHENAIGPDGRYRIEGELGHGAMGVVFLAKDELLSRDVALKKLTGGLDQNMNIVDRFQQEARALAQFSHPHIIQIYDLVKEGHQYWISMEYVEGKDLGSIINEKGKYPIDESLRLSVLLAEAMAYAHNRGVVHRDFKPSNVLITTEGEPKIMDFGLAKLSQSGIATMEGILLGSPAFMSPEQARGEAVDARSDIYALGVTLYQLITGVLPFEGDIKSIITQKIAGHQPSMDLLESNAPADLVAVVKKMMSPDHDDRPENMKLVSQALKNIIEENDRHPL